MQILTIYIFMLLEFFFNFFPPRTKMQAFRELTATEEATPLTLYCNNQTDQVTSTMHITMICRTANGVSFTEFSFV